MSRLAAPRLAGLLGVALVAATAPQGPDQTIAPPAALAVAERSAASGSSAVAQPLPIPAGAPLGVAEDRPAEPVHSADHAVSTKPAVSRAASASPAWVSVGARFLAAAAPRGLSGTPEAAWRFAPARGHAKSGCSTGLCAPRAFAPKERFVLFDDLAASLDTSRAGHALAGKRRDGSWRPRAKTLAVLYASWCRPCVEELPGLLALLRELRQHAPLELVFVSRDDVSGPESLLASMEDLLDRAGLDPEAVPSSTSILADPRGAFARALRGLARDPDALPQLVLFDDRGRIVGHLEGALTETNGAALAAWWRGQ